jgi:lysophospholipid acyltransferase (LPLAT)-like uncharacterized protein
MLATLEDGCTVALTADVPKIARVTGIGIIKLASASGRPIYPLAIATRRRIELNTWDRTSVHLPFTSGAGVVGQPVRVPPNADPAVLESARLALQASLDGATARAYALADRA